MYTHCILEDIDLKIVRCSRKSFDNKTKDKNYSKQEGGVVKCQSSAWKLDTFYHLNSSCSSKSSKSCSSKKEEITATILEMETSTDEPIMSDTTVLVTVEDLINRAMGPLDTNVVNYKLIKVILQIMARQLRIMQQRIEVRSTEPKEELMEKRKMKVSTEKSHSLLARTHIAAKIRRKSTQKYKTKTSNGTTSSESATEDLPESDKENKTKDKREKELQKDEEKKELKTAQEMEKLDKAEVLGGKTEYEEELEEVKEIAKHKASEAVAQEGQKILGKQVLDATADHKESLDIKVSGEKYEEAPESMIEKVVKTERSEARIEITEKHVNDEKILVVVKRPSISLEARSRSGIELVTESQFAAVEAEVGKLISIEFPKFGTLLENQKLMNDIRKGAAKLPEIMLSLQERMKSTEESMTNIVGLLTDLASAGALPEDIAEELGTIIISSTLEEDEKRALVEHNNSVSKPSMSRHSTASIPSTAETENPLSTVLKTPCVTHKEMSAKLKNLKNDFTAILEKIMETPTGMVKSAQSTVKDVAENIKLTQNLHGRISALSPLVVHHNERFTEFESTITPLMESMGHQLAEFRRLVESGLAKCITVNSKAEAEAVMKLKQRYEDLEMKLEEIFFKHKALSVRQTELNKEIRTLIERVKRMQGEKSNRDKFLDQLQDKVERSQLTGILRGLDFSEVRVDFERRIDECNERFNRSDVNWAAVVKDIKHAKDSKADFVELLATRDLVEKQLRDLDSKISIASAMLGDPEVALQSQKLALGAICGSCHEPARVEPYDVRKGAPPRLPALGKPPVEAPKEQFIPDWVRSGKPLHWLCHRWCGGSHTTVQDSSKRMQLKIHLQALPTRKFTDYGDDGRLYMLEEELQPCIQCNVLDGEKTPDHETVDDHLGSKTYTGPLVQ